MKRLIFFPALLCAAVAAQAGAVDTLRAFVRDVKTGRAAFTQAVTAPDGSRRKASTGEFEFSRPNRFRFTYTKPYQQLIVADGQKVWIFDADLNQVSSRQIGQALGATPAALLAGGSLDADFELTDLPPQDGLDWASAVPRQKDGAFKSLRIGFKGSTLSALEIVDNFGQRSMLRFEDFAGNVSVAPEAFRFTPPKGADVLEQ